MVDGSRLSRSGWPKQPKKVIPWPTPVVAGAPLPADPMTWQNAAVLVDKPLSWTSFDVCGKLRGALKIKKVPASSNRSFAVTVVDVMVSEAVSLLQVVCSIAIPRASQRLNH